MGAPRTDGLYRCIQRGDSIHWLRFLVDGTALSASTSPGPASQIACWLRKGAPSYTPQGRWSHDGAGFTATLSTEYRGVVGVTQTSWACAFMSGEDDALFERWTTSSNDARFEGKSGSREYTFIVVPPRYLDGDGRVKEFRSVRSFTKIVEDGLDATLVARLKGTRGLNLALLATAEKGDLVGLGVSEPDAELFLAWRGGRSVR
jgi:hypothetical protein